MGIQGLHTAFKGVVISLLAISLISGEAGAITPPMLGDIRGWGMGGAMFGVGGDLSSIYYNPAGIALCDGGLELLNIMAGATFDTVGEMLDYDEFLDRIRRIQGSDDPINDPALSEDRKWVVERVERIIGELIGVRVPGGMRLVIPLSLGAHRLALGGSIYGFLGGEWWMERRGLPWDDPIKEMLDDAVIYRVFGDGLVIGTLGGAIGLAKGVKLALGSNYKLLRRWIFSDVEDPFTVEDVMNPKGPDGIEGTEDDFSRRFFDPNDPLAKVQRWTGFGLDLGALLSIRDGSIQAGVTLRDLVSSMRSGSSEGKIDPNLAVGASFSPFRTKYMTLLMAFSLDDIGGSVRGGGILDKLHLGAELSLHSNRLISLSARVGNNQGFLTYGFGLRLAILSIGYARYGDEVADWHFVSASIGF
jgi:hypothetical protein